MARATKNVMRSSGPRKVMMAGVEWEEQYGCYTAVLNDWMELNVAHLNGEYHMQVCGRRLTKAANTKEEGAERVVKCALIMARGIVDLLEGAE